jgi:hypothetical protein
MERDANKKNIRPAVKREAECIDVLPRLSFLERSLIAFIFVGLRVLEGEKPAPWRGILQ